MKTLSIDTKEMARPAVTRRWTIRRVLLACGVVSSLFYIVTLSLGALRWEGYSATSQAISELFAIGAPSRPFITPLLVGYALLIYAFGLGVWQSAGPSRALRAAAAEVFGHHPRLVGAHCLGRNHRGCDRSAAACFKRAIL